MSDVLERVKMCIAEAGYDPALAQDGTFPDGTSGVRMAVSIPDDVSWRAMELSRLNPRPICRTCSIDAANANVPATGCEAWRPLLVDCGVDRG